MIVVILLEPETSGNVGAIARVMKNFGFTNLVLVNPHCDHLDQDARNRAKHAQEVLTDAEVTEFFIVDDYDHLIATTAKLGTDYNLTRSPLAPEELALKVQEIPIDKKIGIVIGREGHGMFNEEIEKCDFVVTIPSDTDYATLNISHAVAVLLYELHKVLGLKKLGSNIAPIGRSEKKQIEKMFVELYDKLKWETPDRRVTQVKLWKRILGKAMLTNREAYGVMGLLRKLLGPEKKSKGGKKTGTKKIQKKVAKVSTKQTKPKAKAIKKKAGVEKKSKQRKTTNVSAKKGSVKKKSASAKKKTVAKKKPVKKNVVTKTVAKKKPVKKNVVTKTVAKKKPVKKKK